MLQHTIHFRVAGRVQGVFFRAECSKVATANGISGWVRNLPYGCVEGVATGESGSLQVLREWLARGPSRAKVIQLEVQQLPLQAFDSFTIRA